MLDEMSPDAVVPYLVERRLLSEEEAKEVHEKSNHLDKMSTILKALSVNTVVGRLSTLCAVLISVGLTHIAEKMNESEYIT